MEQTNTVKFKQMSNEDLCLYVRNNHYDGWNVLVKRSRRYCSKVAGRVIREAHADRYLIPVLMDEVTESLYEAVERFDPERGTTFFSFAGRILYNRMMEAMGIFCHPQELFIEDLRWRRLEEDGEDWLDYHVLTGNVTEDVAVRKVYFEEFRDCFLGLADAQQMVLSYKFGYDPQKPVLTCRASCRTDRAVALHFHSKTNIVRKIKEEGYHQIRTEFL